MRQTHTFIRGSGLHEDHLQLHCYGTAQGQEHRPASERTPQAQIDLLDPLVEERCTFGNWELDTVVGNKDTDPVLLAADERKEKKRHLVKIQSKTAEAVAEEVQCVED